MLQALHIKIADSITDAAYVQTPGTIALAPQHTPKQTHKSKGKGLTYQTKHA